MNAAEQRPIVPTELPGGTHPAIAIAGHGGFIDSLLIDPNGQFVITAGRVSPIIRAWALDSGAPLWDLDLGISVGSAALLSERDLLACALCDGEKSIVLTTFDGDVERIGTMPHDQADDIPRSLVVNREQTRVACALWHHPSFTLCDLVDGRVTTAVMRNAKWQIEWSIWEPLTLAFDGTGRWLAAACKTGVRVYDTGKTWGSLQTPKPAVEIPLRESGVVHYVGFAPDGRTLHWTINRYLNAADTQTGTVKSRFRYDWSPTGWCAAAVSPNGKTLVAGMVSGEIVLCDFPQGTNPRRITKAFPCQVSAVAWLPDGSGFAAGSASGGVKVWKV